MDPNLVSSCKQGSPHSQTIQGTIPLSLPLVCLGSGRRTAPTPIGMYLVQLVKVENNLLYVTNIDAVDGTPVIDIKPYYENDIVFSPRTPNIKPVYRKKLIKLFFQTSYRPLIKRNAPAFLWEHAWLYWLKRSSATSIPLSLAPPGGRVPPCLADTLQGLSRAQAGQSFKIQIRIFPPSPGQAPGTEKENY